MSAWRRYLVGVLLAGLTLPALAEAPSQSLRPDQRPGQAAPAPDPLPDGIRRVVVSGTALAPDLSLRPNLRPDGLEQRTRATATRQTPSRVAQPGVRGALCGRPGLVGERLEPIPGRIAGCGIAEPVRLREVNGIRLTQPATVNCRTAEALQTWVEDSVVPTVGRRGGGVDNLRVVASYACRTRNHRPGARLSEHATGNAIDIAGIGLANGRELTVSGGWRNRQDGRLLQQMHRGACGPFGTVLGPNSDRFHQDHFHFDVASYRSGPFCR
ncbi:MAG: extensin family protein [Pseudomonadota bacterium]